MLRVNPPTAYLMLHQIVAPKPGQLGHPERRQLGRRALPDPARAGCAGVKTVNVVRRDELVAPLRAFGGDVVLTDGPDLDARVRAAIGEAALPLAIDAVGGSGTQRLARCVSDGGTVVNYGLLSGEPCMVDGRETVFRDVRLQGFWLRKWFVDTAARADRGPVSRAREPRSPTAPSRWRSKPSTRFAGSKRRSRTLRAAAVRARSCSPS